MPDLILYHGKVHTQDPEYARATAIAIRGNRLLAIGDDADIRALAGPRARSIDLGGRLVLPGLIDAHCHLSSWALGLRRLLLADVPSLADLCRRVAEQASRTPPGAWILGRGWNETRWPRLVLPTRGDLDAVTTAHPVLLWRNDMHLAVANSRALQEAAITTGTPDPPQGVIDRDASGRPTGVLRELAINMVTDGLPPTGAEEMAAAIREGIPLLHRLGLTGVHDCRVMGGGAGRRAFHAYQQLRAAGDLALRTWMHLPGERLAEAVAIGLRTGLGDDYLRVGHLKLFSDGSQGAGTAWMLEPYEDTNGCGMPLTPMEEIADLVPSATRAGISTAIHAIGDRAVRELVSVFEQAPAGARSLPAPHRIEHLQNIRPEDVARLGRLGMVGSVQPIHATDDIPMVERSVGRRARFSYPFRDLLAAGVTLALGSDSPVADPNPLWGIHAAVTRQRRDGAPPGGWYPDQRLTVVEAVWGYTMGPALATGLAADLGSITPGKLADLVVLDRDVFAIDPAEIHKVRVAMTVFDGRVVHDT